MAAVLPCRVVCMGLVPYTTAWELQHKLVVQRQQGLITDTLLLLEHAPTYTYGRGSNGREHLLSSAEELRRLKVEVYEVDRGGDITFHGPGQIVGYPILDLKAWHRDGHLYVHTLEDVLIRGLADVGVSAQRLPGHTGVWVGEAKIASIGIKLSRWVTSHGFALNVDPGLDYFRRILPCGIFGLTMTSVAQALGRPVDGDGDLLKERLIHHFGDLFGRHMIIETALYRRSEELLQVDMTFSP